MTNILGFFLGLRTLACALTDSEQTPHEEKRQQAAALQRAQWTIVLVAAGLLRVHLCLSVVSFILLVAVLTRSTSARKLEKQVHRFDRVASLASSCLRGGFGAGFTIKARRREESRRLGCGSAVCV